MRKLILMFCFCFIFAGIARAGDYIIVYDTITQRVFGGGAINALDYSSNRYVVKKIDEYSSIAKMWKDYVKYDSQSDSFIEKTQAEKYDMSLNKNADNDVDKLIAIKTDLLVIDNLIANVTDAKALSALNKKKAEKQAEAQSIISKYQ